MRTDEKLVLVVGDVHGNTEFMCDTIRIAARQDISRIMQVGDFGIWPGDAGRRFLAQVSNLAARHEIRVDFIDGNHEDFDQLDAARENGLRHDDGSIEIAPNVHWWPRGSTTVWGGRHIGFLGGAVSVDRQRRWPHQTWWPQERIDDSDVKTLITNADGVALDVLFTHDVTNLVNIPSSGLWPADVLADAAATRDQIDIAVQATRPYLLVHGHWHLRYRTRIDVAGSPVDVEGLGCEDPTRAVCVLDLDELVVRGDAYELDDLLLKYGT